MSMTDNYEIKFIKSYNSPDSNAADYWVDLDENKYGGVIKYFDKDICEWKVILFDLKIVDQLQTWLTCALSAVEKTLYKELDGVNTKINILEHTVEGINNNVDEITNNISEITNNINLLTNGVDKLTNDVNKLTSDVDKLTNNVNDLTENVNLNITNLQQQITNVNNKFTDEYVTQLINNLVINNKIDILDPVLKAINKGSDVQLPLPSNNLNKISLPIWIGTTDEFNAIANNDEDMVYFVWK